MLNFVEFRQGENVAKGKSLKRWITTEKSARSDGVSLSSVAS